MVTLTINFLTSNLRIITRSVGNFPTSFKFAFPFGKYDTLVISALIGLVILTFDLLSFDLEIGAHEVGIN